MQRIKSVLTTLAILFGIALPVGYLTQMGLHALGWGVSKELRTPAVERSVSKAFLQDSAARLEQYKRDLEQSQEVLQRMQQDLFIQKHGADAL